MLCFGHLVNVDPFGSMELFVDSKVIAIEDSMLKVSSRRNIAITDSILKICVGRGTMKKDVNKWKL